MYSHGNGSSMQGMHSPSVDAGADGPPLERTGALNYAEATITLAYM